MAFETSKIFVIGKGTEHKPRFVHTGLFLFCMQGTVTYDIHSGDGGGRSSCGNRLCASRPLYTVHISKCICTIMNVVIW